MAAPKFSRGWHRGIGDATHSQTGDVLEILIPGDSTDTHARQLHITQAGCRDTDWGLAAQTDPMIVLHSTTTPTTDYLTVTHDGTTATYNAAGATTLAFQIAGTSAYSTTACVFDLASVDLQMQACGQILDNNGAEFIQFVTTASALNGWRFVNAASTCKPIITTEGTADTGMIFAGYDGTNTEEVLILCAAATAINEVTITSGASGTDAKIAGTTSATNAGLTFDTAGTGQITFQLGGTDNLNFHDVSGATFAAAATVAGHASFIQTEDGGAACASTVAGAGAALQLLTGDGGVAVCGAAAAAGGAFTLEAGAGGIGFASASGNAADGGVMNLTSGGGGNAGNNAGSAPGNGGTLAILAGAGGTATAACDAAGNGADITITAGVGGAAAGACASAGGNGGDVTISVGAGGTASSSCGANDGGDAGDLYLRTGTAVESGAVGTIFIRNATTGLGVPLETAACCTFPDNSSGAGVVFAVTTWIAATATPANTAVLVVSTA